MWWLWTAVVLANDPAPAPSPASSTEPAPVASPSPEAPEATGDPADETPPPSEPSEPAGPDQPEYNRLTQELEKLANRNAWAGVERTFVKLVATQIEPSFKDLMFAANAARALGNTAAARERLMAAKDLQEDPAVFDWLFEIDQNYGKVALQCEPGVGWALTTEQRPFQPDRIRSVEFAAAAIAESCAFEGMIPVGTYAFGAEPLEVEADGLVARRDLRGQEPPADGG